MSLEEIAQANINERLVDNPCRGIVLGMNEESKKIILAWIMGRHYNSKNRVYVTDGNDIRAEPADPSKVIDPLIVYNAMREIKVGVIVSNGDQTDTVCNAMADFSESGPGSFFGVLSERYCRSDSPIFTPRISGFMPFIPDNVYMSILKADPHEKERWLGAVEKSGKTMDDFRKSDITDVEVCKAYNKFIGKKIGLDACAFPTIRQTFDYPLKPGYGYCITTYNPGSVQLNTFEGEPFIVPVRGNTEEVMERFWNSLEPKWRVALCGKSIEGSQIYTAKNININVQKKR